MRLKLTGNVVNRLALAGALSLVTIPCVTGVAAPAYSMQSRGGQPAPSAVGGTATFVVIVASGLAEGTANQLKNGLVADGFTTAEARSNTSGQYRVVVAGLPSRQQADQVLAELKSSGYTPEGVQSDQGAAAGALSETIFRVEVAEFNSEQEAEEARKTLADEGFVNVDIVPENGRFLLLMGTFNRRQDADALLSEVSGAGFSLAEVVQRGRMRGQSAGAGTTADLSQLPASEQAETRDVLAMAQKVESGEATAEEIKRLRERIQQLTAGQKDVIAQEESSRATEREKLQQIFPLYREFDHAMTARDFDTAEQALEKVRAIDPNDIFLSGREQALQNARSGGTAAPATGDVVDPAQVQATINEARKLERDGNREQALAKYREVVAMDPTNSEARGKVAELAIVGASSQESGEAEADSGNNNLLYGAIGLVALVGVGWFLMSRKKKPASDPTPRATSFGGSAASDFGDPLADGGSFNTAPSTEPTDLLEPGAAAGTPTVGAPAFETFGSDDDEEEEAARKPKPAPKPAAPAEPESDTVSLEGFGDDDSASAPAPAPEKPAADQPISLHMDDESAPAEQQSTQPGGSALDADLESLLKSSIPGTADDLQSATPGRGVEELQSVGEPAEPRLVFQQSFDQEAEDAVPADWRGEYDYASLTIQRLDEAGHTQALRYSKPEGTGSATYHLTFPEARGRVTAEFDVRCDEKNKFLLGVYLEKDEDFKQSIHTIVHQLDANAPAALRIQGEATPYELGTWSHVRYEIDLTNGTVDGYVDNEQVVKGAALASAPEYLNTLSIRDNLATTGTLLLDNIRITEA